MMGDATGPGDDDTEGWARLTDKQRACLDLLLLRKTSKEIARELGISKYTVDQRLRTARAVLGASDRDDTALIYARLRQICDRIAYHPVDVPSRPALVPSHFPDGGQADFLMLDDSIVAAQKPPSESSPFKGLWRRDYRVARKVMFMAVLLATIIIALSGGLGVVRTLSQLISG